EIEHCGTDLISKTEKQMRPSKVLIYQSAGFLALIGLSWMDEALGLRSLILGDHPYISDFRESTLEMLFTLAVWLLVFGSTRRLLGHVSRLERLMKVCAWCRRIRVDGRWLPLEEFLDKKLEAQTTHSICEECLDKQEAVIDASDPLPDPNP